MLYRDSSLLFGAEFGIGHSVKDEALFFYLVLPFGFSGSHGVFGRMMQGAKWLRAQYSPGLPVRNGDYHCRCDIFCRRNVP